MTEVREIGQSQIREMIIDEVRKELLGPSGETGNRALEDEIITENPESRYATGILYPLEEEKLELVAEENLFWDGNSDEVLDQEQDEVLDEESVSAVLDHGFKPQSLGITFYLEGTPEAVEVRVHTALYTKVKGSSCFILDEHQAIVEDLIKDNPVLQRNLTIKGNELDYRNKGSQSEKEEIKEFRNEMEKLQQNVTNNDDKNLNKTIIFYLRKLESFYSGRSYRREPYQVTKSIPLNERKTVRTLMANDQEIVKLEAYIKEIPSIDNKLKSLTVVVRNISRNPLFQTEIRVKSQPGFKFFPAEKISVPDIRHLSDDERDNLLLFQNQNTYAVGHGASAEWESDSNGEPIEVYTSYIPTFEVKPMDFNVASIPENVLKPQTYISASAFQAAKYMNQFIQEYEKWITVKEKEITSFPPYLKETGQKNIEKCRTASSRMHETVNLLREDEAAWIAFQKANEAMLLQRMRGATEKEQAYISKAYEEVDFKWRPFQFAFILHSFESFINQKSEYRDVLDLIWVTTGGGKTEAYLFAIAAVIFYRRQFVSAEDDGVTVMMRYTLRLLTAQQFERAASLICACEYIRSKESLFGEREISIGLWVGSKNTPNKRADANELIREMWESNVTEAKKKNKFQLLQCPWCNEEDSLIPKDENGRKGHIFWGYQESKSRNGYHNFRCTNKQCFFSKNLPIHVVDEDIYEARPTLLFGTVDKFAQIALNGETSSLFGTDKENKKSPELIIQDELHLISGPLGSIVGSYEAAIDYLLQRRGQHPKYIASTATIKNAVEQVQALYNRQVHLFPPNGIEQEDNFFVKENKDSHGRKYVGIMATGKTQITTEIRLIAALLHAIHAMLLEPQQKDPYWTVAGYFNSIRELGKASSLIKDDVNDYLSIISKRNNQKKRFLSDESTVELTSRVPSADIPEIIKQLETHYTGTYEKGLPSVVDILTATNMLSVGIDISRLNTMFVVGQPKLTSEYIQATSRVGRKDLGVVFALYNSSRSRDRSHYETFQSYHQSLYKYVEPSSVTPYSIPSLQRTLAAVLVTMFRNSNPSLIENKSARYLQEHKEELLAASNFLTNRIQTDEGTKEMYFDDAMKVLEDFCKDWEEMAGHNEEEENLYYYFQNSKQRQGNEKYLTRSFNDKDPIEDAWEVMNSMRNIEQVSEIDFI